MNEKQNYPMKPIYDIMNDAIDKLSKGGETCNLCGGIGSYTTGGSFGGGTTTHQCICETENIFKQLIDMKITEFDIGYLVSSFENAIFSILKNSRKNSDNFTLDPGINLDLKQDRQTEKISNILNKINVPHSVKSGFRIYYGKDTRIVIGGYSNIKKVYDLIKDYDLGERSKLLKEFVFQRCDKLNINGKARYDIVDIEYYEKLYKINNPSRKLEIKTKRHGV